MEMQTEKLQIMKMLLETQDKSILKQILAIFEKRALELDLWDELHDEVKADVEESIAELSRGEGISHTVVMKKHEKWLKK